MTLFDDKPFNLSYPQKAAKRKKIHAFKSKVRFEQLELTQNKRQNSWQQFQSAKGKTKKVWPMGVCYIFIHFKSHI